MSSLQTNISKGAIRVSETLIIGGYAETCNICDSYKSSDGCSNPSCILFRGEPIMQTVLRERRKYKQSPFRYITQ